VKLGIDYAWNGPTPQEIKDSGYTFALRYASHDPKKDLTNNERIALHAAGIGVGIIWETTAGRALSGAAAGIEDGHDFAVRLIDLAWPAGVMVYAAVDFDVQPSQVNTVREYVNSMSTVLGRPVSVYGGYMIADWFRRSWQTYAWSHGQWSDHAAIRQVHNGITVGGADCDRDELYDDSVIWWPTTAPTPTPPALLPPVFQGTVRLGSTGYAVKVVQARLAARGWTITVDGFFGRQTDTVVRQFQKEKHLTVDGIAGPITWSALWTAPIT
jgi:hypothetical protein